VAFDPNEFLAETTETKKESAPAPAVQTAAPSSGFDPHEFIKGQAEAETAPQPGTPAPQFAVPGPTGINPGEVAATVRPMGEAAMNIGKGYVRHPLEAVADVAAMHMGMPPPIASMKGLQGVGQMYQGVKDTLNNVNFKLGALQEAGPEVRQAFDSIVGKLPSNIIEEIQTKGANALKSAQLPENLLQDAEFMKNWNLLKGQTPSLAQKAGAVLGPVARGIGKVAGPAGLAMNAYDAAQYAQQAQLGQRLAEGQGQAAQRNFRQMNPGYGQGFVSNISPDQAANILQNGSPRDIQAMGGQQALDELIRQKAAAKALQPIAPGSI
jgi:hypothetical protein